MEPGTWLDLMADDTPALRVQFFGAVPAPSQRYWRGPVLSLFDGKRWEQDRPLIERAPAAARRIGLSSRDELEQAALLPFADDALAARNMSAATGRVCERVMEPLAEPVACPRASRFDA